jgi:uncharacterized protein
MRACNSANECFAASPPRGNPGNGIWWVLGAWLVLLPLASVSAQEAASTIPSVKADGSVSTVKSTWLPPNVDEEVPPVEAGTACSLDEVVQKAEKRILELVQDVDRFTATESLTHESFDKHGRASTPTKRKFDYVVSIQEVRHGHLGVNEYRNGGLALDEFPGGIATYGLPALVLIFHPYYAPNYEMTCEGLAYLNARLTWQVHFRQRPDQPNELKTYQFGITGASHSVGIKGRAWISADSYQIVRMETDLIAPVPQIQLLADHTAIEYGPVKFRGAVNLWLPLSAEVYFAWRGQRVHRIHSFDRYMLFTVDDKQSISTPISVTDAQVPRTKTSVTELSDLRGRAEEVDVKSQYEFGRIYMFGLGVSQDYQQAAKWYELAADGGLPAAQFTMGFLYEQGKGVRQDYSRALEYYHAAADQGHSTAANNLASLYLHGLGTPKNIGTALKWYQFSAEHGDATGQCNLATFYFVGKDVPKDYHEAAHWFRAAAEQGFPAAENNLAFLYFTGEGVVQDYGEAFKWMSRAAEQGYAQAQVNLGDLYVEGKGVSLDYVTAYMWYRLGSAGDPRAATRIKNLSRLITSKQRIEAQGRASAWLSSHRNLDVKDAEEKAKSTGWP